ncbi:MAG: aspartate-semialdehyde dehydrogenase [Deltaproteobacteria bacterium]|jgi:aspartate-semialdehyde dehydrogenase|nr:aspartate-semialdehyde dehydrogenase [Deltaproteobacteria bacterium]
MAQGFKVAVVGATGMVGAEMLRVLEQRAFPVTELVPVASARSAGRTVTFKGAEHSVVEIAPEVFEGVDLALFSAGGGTSREWSPIAAGKGALVVDNSSAFRADPECPLVVPEVNPDAAAKRPKGIIANPNCSTIQMVVALKPLHDEARLKRVVVATYQAISGSGAIAVSAFEAQEEAMVAGREVDKSQLSGQLSRNLLMHWKPDPATGYQEEELKMVSETRKIFGDPTISVSPTAVRVPVITGHSEAVTVECHAPISAARARELLSRAEGVEVVDDFVHGIYPQPIDAAGRDPVYVGRIREDVGNPGGIQMWVVSDNLRKGAALNAVQIAEKVLLK